MRFFLNMTNTFAKLNSKNLELSNSLIHVHLSFSSVSFNSDMSIPQGCHALVKMAISEVKRSHDK